MSQAGSGGALRLREILPRLLAVIIFPLLLHAESPPEDPVRPDAILLTIFLKHDQGLTLAEIQKLQEEQGFWKAFPPEGTRVVSWYVMMGIGQVVTLEVPASKLRDVNVALEKTEWKAFRTEFYPTYDLYPIIRDKLANPAKKSP